MPWQEYDNRQGGAEPTQIGVTYSFNLEVRVGEILIARSDGRDVEGGEIQQDIFDRFQVTIDQLEGEITVPYRFVRELSTLTLFGNEVLIPIQFIQIQRPPLGGFAQFRINYQYVDQVTEEVYSGEVITPRVLVPRLVLPPPPPPPPIFTIDENQIKEAFADKIYEKFFSDPNIDTSALNIQSLQTTISDDGVGYKTGRTSDDEQLILFKKDRNTPENSKDFYNDQTDENPINQIVLHLSQSFAGSDANGVIDLSSKLDDEINITSVTDNRIPSVQLDPPEFFEGTTAPLYYLEVTRFRIEYQRFQQGPIIAPFGEIHKFFEQNEGDVKFKPDEWVNKVNLSQLTKPEAGAKVNPSKAKDTLDTNIFELLPAQAQRQDVIDKFFKDFYNLIGPAPSFDDVDDDGAGELISSEDLQTQFESRISYVSSSNQAFITRTDDEADEVNANKTLETMRNVLNDYLGDVDNVVEELSELPEYQNKSEGFLKLRKYNQAIILRDPIDILEIEKPVTVIDEDTGDEVTGPSWAVDGFTITMWVRFLNTTTGGSLMTYGNPMIKGLPGFRLDTQVRSDLDDEGSTINSRMVRLVVWENTFSNGSIYDSHFGRNFNPNPDQRGDKFQTSQAGGNPIYEQFIAEEDASWYVFNQHTQIPTDDLNEWFFICATYDPNIDEDGSFDTPELIRNKQFWLNHVDPNPQMEFLDVPPFGPTGNSFFNTVGNSGFGNKCKVEIISKTNLLRARGFKV